MRALRWPAFPPPPTAAARSRRRIRTTPRGDAVAPGRRGGVPGKTTYLECPLATLRGGGAEGGPSPAADADGAGSGVCADGDDVSEGGSRDCALVGAEDQWRRSLPDRLRDRRGTLCRIDVPVRLGAEGCDDSCELYLLGTSHVSKDSCVDSRLLVEHLRPDCLFLELCSKRLNLLYEDGPPPPSSQEEGGGGGERKRGGIGSEASALMSSNPEMTRSAALSAVLLTRVQGDYATKLGVTVGGEFREGYRAATLQQERYRYDRRRREIEARANAKAVEGDGDDDAAAPRACAVVLGDRPILITLLRAWESLSLLGKVRLILGLLWSCLRQPSEEELRKFMEEVMNDPAGDLLSKSIEELGRHFPTIRKVIIDERDRYMVAKIVQTAHLVAERGYHQQRISEGGGIRNGTTARRRRRTRIVAVVGAGHVPGMCRLLSSGEEGNSCGDRGSFVRWDAAEGSPEDVLRGIVETRRFRLDESETIRSLTTDVVGLHLQ